MQNNVIPSGDRFGALRASRDDISFVIASVSKAIFEKKDRFVTSFLAKTRCFLSFLTSCPAYAGQTNDNEMDLFKRVDFFCQAGNFAGSVFLVNDAFGRGFGQRGRGGFERGGGFCFFLAFYGGIHRFHFGSERGFGGNIALAADFVLTVSFFCRFMCSQKYYPPKISDI